MIPEALLAEAAIAVSETRHVVRYPDVVRPLPSPADLERTASLPLVQLFVVGRSGSGLIHAFLDGHPAVLHVPHTFKFYDFVAANPDLPSLSSEEVIDRFMGSPLVQLLFDSERSVIIGGRLGRDRSTYVRIDADRFKAAFLSATRGQDLSERLIFLAIVLAYGWCVGQPIARARVVLHHVHHGDWLWPERLIERANYHTPLSKPPSEILQADKYLVSVREPYDTAGSYLRFVDKIDLDPRQRIDAQEQFLRLMIQDWLRLVWVERWHRAVHVIRLEDLRADAARVMRECAAWLDIDPDSASLTQLTYYGFEWYGDIYTKADRQIHSSSAPHGLGWQDRWFVDAAIAAPARAHGYRRRVGTAARLRAALLRPLTVLFPSRSLRRSDMRGWRRYRLAQKEARRRVAFVDRVHQVDPRA